MNEPQLFVDFEPDADWTLDWDEIPKDIQDSVELVRFLMKKDGDGLPVKSKENCLIAFEHDPILSGAFRKNDMTEQIDIVKNVGWHRESKTMTDSDWHHILFYMDIMYHQGSEKNVEIALSVSVEKHHYHPVRDKLNSLQWDGTPRVYYALHHFLGADLDELNYVCLQNIMLGAIHRVFNPGCKFENMLCLVGKQGAGKSSFFRLLAMKDEWFSDDLRNLSDEKIFLHLNGHWIIEMAEMVGTANAKSVEEIKSFLSRQKDNHRTAYAKFAKDRPRQCIFVGSTNNMRFLPLDRTGNRRFLPVMTHIEKAEVSILENEAESRAYIEQMWAEMMALYRSGKWSLVISKEYEVQLDKRRLQFMAEDTLTGVIQAWLEQYKGEYVCTKMLYAEALGGFGEPDRKSINEINDIMNNCIPGWVSGPSSKRFHGYGIQRAWHRDVINGVQTELEGFPFDSAAPVRT